MSDTKRETAKNLLAQGMSVEDVCRELNVDRLYLVRNALVPTDPRKARITEKVKQEDVVEAYLRLHNVAHVMHELSISRYLVRRHLHAAGISFSNPGGRPRKT